MIIRGVRRIAFTLRVAEVDVESVTSEEAMGNSNKKKLGSEFNSILFFSFGVRKPSKKKKGSVIHPSFRASTKLSYQKCLPTFNSD